MFNSKIISVGKPEPPYENPCAEYPIEKNLENCGLKVKLETEMVTNMKLKPKMLYYNYYLAL